MGLSTISFILYFLYPVSLIAVSIYISRNKEMTLNSYFFANRDVPWFIAALSLLTSSLFSPYILGLSYASISGFPVIYGVFSTIILITAGWFIFPKYFDIKINTLPEYFERRFNKTCKYFFSSIYIFSNVFIRLIIILVLSGFFFNVVTGIDAYSTLLFILIITGVYLIIGGLHAEMYINIIQAVFISLVTIGFLSWVISQGKGFEAVTQKVSSLTLSSLEMNSGTTWWGIFFGIPILAFWFWCADQFIVQKVISIRNLNSVRKTTISAAIFQILPTLIFILPAIILIILTEYTFNDGLLHRFFFDSVLPDALKGGLIIAVAAALMASLGSLFNSTSMLITFDFFKSLNPDASDRKLVLVGRLTTLFLMFWGIVLIPVTQTMEFSFCIKLFKVFSYFASLIAAIFIISLINKKINSTSAILSLCIGILIILFRSISELFYSNHIYSIKIFNMIMQPDFLEFSAVISLISVLLLFVFRYISEIDFIKRFQEEKILNQLKLKSRWNIGKTVLLALSLIIMLLLAGIIFI